MVDEFSFSLFELAQEIYENQQLWHGENTHAKELSDKSFPSYQKTQINGCFMYSTETLTL